MQHTMSYLMRMRDNILIDIEELRHEIKTWPQTDESLEIAFDEIRRFEDSYDVCMSKIKIEYINHQKKGIEFYLSKELLDEIESLPNIQNKPIRHTEPMTPQL